MANPEKLTRIHAVVNPEKLTRFDEPADRPGRSPHERPGRPWWAGPGVCDLQRDQAMSKRSAFETLTQADTKSFTNFSFASSLA